MAIYGDSFFVHLSNKFTYFKSADINNYNLPDNCDVIAISFFCNNYLLIQATINFYQPKTKKLLVYISEPTENGLIDFLKNQESNVFFFGDAVLNEKVDNFSTVISWFMSPINYYKEYYWAKRLAYKSQINRFNKNYMFDCLLGTKKSHRNLIYNFINTHPEQKKFILTYYKNFECMLDHGIWDFPDSSITGHNITIQNTEVNVYSILPVSIYNDSYYSIVAETTCLEEHNQYTEKIAKPIIAKRPFVVFSGSNYLKNLRSLGFKTFHSIIDESYDSEPVLSKRFKLIFEQIEYMLTADPQDIYDRCRPMLEHNHNHFINTNWWAPILQHLE